MQPSSPVGATRSICRLAECRYDSPILSPMDLRRSLGRLKVGRFFDWVLFTAARLRASGTVTADSLPYCEFPFRLEVKRGATLHIGYDCRFRSGFRVYAEKGATIDIGDKSIFSGNNLVASIDRITFGEASMIGPRVTILDADHVFSDLDRPIWMQGAVSSPVEIGEDTWIGAGAVVVKASVGAHSVVGANAVVTKSIPPKSIAVGIPARVVKSRGEGHE